MVDNMASHPAQIAEAVRSNPNYEGGPCRLLSCNAANGPAQELADELGADVWAPTSRVGTLRYGPPGVILEQGGEWKCFSPRT